MVFNVPINLPWFISIHAAGLTVIGLSLLDFIPSFSSRPAEPTSSIAKRTSTTAPQPNPALGIATVALGLAYFFTSYMPVAENQFLYATVPVRMILGVAAGLRVINGGLEEKERKNMLGIAVYDGFGGLILGWYLGTWTGRVPGT